MAYQVLQYSCSCCVMILKKMAEDPYQSLLTTNTEEECPNCDSVLFKNPEERMEALALAATV